jgi:hypothetical protein
MNKLLNLIEIQDSDLVELLAGKRPELEVGMLPFEVRQNFGCSRETVFLSDESIRHIVQKHGDHIGNHELKYLPQILTSGLWLADDRPTHAIAICEVEGVRYKCVVKVTVDRRRTYVKTLHRLSPRQTNGLMRKSRVIRPSWF